MSARMLAMVFEFYPVGGGEYALALAIADRADEFGENIRPGVATLSRKARLSERQTTRVLAKMVRDGWLQEVKASHGRGSAAFTEFKINPQWIHSCGVRPNTEDRSEKMTGQNVTSTGALPKLSGQNDMTKCHLNDELTRQNVTSTPEIPPLTRQNVTSMACGKPVDNLPAVLTILPPLISPPKVEELANADRRFCEFFLFQIRKLNPLHSPPRNWERWERDVRLMRERDGRSLRELATMMRWVADDDFWCAQILSPGKLRAKWDQLTAKRALQQRKAAPVLPQLMAQRVCACGCGKPGVRSFRIDGSEWWAAACYQREALRREVA